MISRFNPVLKASLALAAGLLLNAATMETKADPRTTEATAGRTVNALYGPSEPRGLLARFGNPHGGLPHTVLLDAKRQTCAQRTGEVDEDWLRNALNRCTTYQGRP